MSLENQLFTVEEALIRIGENHLQGHLLIRAGSEKIDIYVRDGIILEASGAGRHGKDAAEKALHIAHATYTWERGVQPPSGDLDLNIREFIHKFGSIHRDRIAQTGRLGLGSVLVREEVEPKYKYFLVPDTQPTVKLYLTKIATVLGRNQSSDLVVDDRDVSRRHCLLDIQARGLFMLDLNSMNGTYVNGILVTDGYLSHGDKLELGPYPLTVNREAVKRG
ncbi:MAG: FHA domain-containing protein [Methylacidiphilales bacterium]|nr:FHA domain-containing protein [Candidatus Methylacidiphilales bacterium]